MSYLLSLAMMSLVADQPAPVPSGNFKASPIGWTSGWTKPGAGIMVAPTRAAYLKCYALVLANLHPTQNKPPTYDEGVVYAFVFAGKGVRPNMRVDSVDVTMIAVNQVLDGRQVLAQVAKVTVTMTVDNSVIREYDEKVLSPYVVVKIPCDKNCPREAFHPAFFTLREKTVNVHAPTDP